MDKEYGKIYEHLKEKGLIPEGEAANPFSAENNPILRIGQGSLAAAQSLAQGQSLGEAVGEMRKQFQPNRPQAPSGEELSQYVLQQKMPQTNITLNMLKAFHGNRPVTQLPKKLLGMATEAAVDVSNLLPGKIAMGTLGAVAGSLATKGGVKSSQILAKQDPLGFYSKLEDLVLSKMGKSATPEQVMSIAKGAKEEEVAVSGLADFLKGKEKVSQEDVLQQIRESRPKLQEVVKGGTKNALDSSSPYYQIPAVRKIVETEQGAAGIEMALANDGDAYRALMKKFPELEGKENWEEIVVQDVLAKAKNKQFKPTKFHELQESGGKNYREVLITLPSNTNGQKRYDELQQITDRRPLTESESEEMVALERALTGQQSGKAGKEFYSSHWDEPNVLAHARVNERVDETGKKLLHVEEIQSDWHQKGREVGYFNESKYQRLKQERSDLEDQMENITYEGLVSEKEFDAMAREYAQKNDVPLMAARNKMRSEMEGRNKIAFDKAKQKKSAIAEQITEKEKEIDRMRTAPPSAPFKKNWMELMAKRLIRQAVESGADRMSWTPGVKQAARYDLSKQVRSISVGKNPDGTFEYVAVGHHGGEVQRGTSVPKEKLQDAIGKDLAQKAIDSKETWTDFEGLDLRVGGEGMQGFYDKILPDFLRKFGKKYDAEVGETTTNGMKVPFLELTPKLKKAVMEEGLPLFQIGGAVGLGGLIDQMRSGQENEPRR